MANLKTFSDRLKSKMDERNVSQSDMARYIQTERATISKYCSGMHVPRNVIMTQIAIFLDCSLQWLKTGKGDPNEQFDYSRISSGEIGNRVNIEKDCASGSYKLSILISEKELKTLFSKIFFK